MNHYNIDRLRESMVKILGSHGQPVAGSGFIIRSDGYLVTCHHVIYVLDALNVEYQGQIYQAEWCEELSNPEVDIAILKIDVENAKAVPIINPQHLSTSVTVYGFPPSQKKYFPEGIAVSAQSIRRSAPLNTVSTYRTREIKATNPWNKLPQDESTFLSHRIDAKVDAGTSGGAVFAEELGGVVGVIQCSKSDESYVIRWDNITEYLDKLGLEPEKNAVCRFLKEIENNFKYDKLLHIPEQPIILKDQYIPIQVTLERKYTHAVETTWGYAESEAELKQAYALKRLEESQQSQVDWKEAKKQHQRIMVLADPGMGKSTLLRREACLTAQEERQSLKNNTKKLEDVVFPLFLRLSHLAETPEEIIDAMPVLIQRECSETATQVMELLRDKLKTGKCLLLLDALDEVPTEQRQRQRLIEKLNRFAQRKSPCPIICTSRIVGYSGAFVAGVKEVEIVPFSQKQIEQYIETWFRNAAGYLNDDTVSASSLIRELRNKPQIRGLAQNPLLLSLICSLYQEKGLTLPARRCLVYEQAVRYMLGKWSKNRNPELNDTWIDAKTELLEELAYQFSCDGKEIFAERELRHKIDKYLRSENASSDFRDKNASCLIIELSEQDGILQKLHEDGDKYLFPHRTFQEYLTACYLKQASNGIALVKQHFWEYNWHETLSLLAGLMENPVPLLQAITDVKDDIFKTLLLLAGRCIAECPENPHSLIAEIIDRIYKFWHSYPNAGFIESIVVALGKVNSQMFQRLQKALNYSDWGVREQAVRALSQISNPEAVAALIGVFQTPVRKIRDWIVREQAALTLAKIGNPQTLELLIADLNSSNRFVREQAASILAQIGNPQALEILIADLNNLSIVSFIIWLTLLVVDGRVNPQAVEVLVTVLNDSDKGWFRAWAASALAKIGNPQGLEFLIAALNDSDNDVRQYAASALARIGNYQGVEVLITALNDSDNDVRRRAASALADISNPQGLEILIALLNDSNADVRQQATLALEKIGNPETLAKLIQVPEIDIYDPAIFPLARKLAVRFSKERLPFIPVYPELVAHKQ
jgi:HEAT repeat protein